MEHDKGVDDGQHCSSLPPQPVHLPACFPHIVRIPCVGQRQEVNSVLVCQGLHATGGVGQEVWPMVCSLPGMHATSEESED